MTEELCNLERLVKNAIAEKQGKWKVYVLYHNYEDEYCKIKKPTSEEQCNYIQLYFSYMGYMGRKGI